MGSVYLTILLFLAVVLAALVAFWFYARAVKRDLDAPPSGAAGARAVIELTPASAARLRALSAEPILLKQSDAGVRVQIERRPMLPLMAFVGQEVSGALTEAAGRISEQWGPTWVALVSARDDATAAVQRLS